MSSIREKLNRFYAIKKLDEESLTFISQFERNGEYNLDEGDDLSGMDFDVRCDVHVHGKFHVCPLLLNYYNAGHKEIYEQLVRCFAACIKDRFNIRGFWGEYYGMDLLVDLLKNGISNILKPDSEEANTLKEFVDYVRTWKTIDTYRLKEILELYDQNVIFTYGTLMKNRLNHHFLKDDEYIGDAILEDYGLIELGYFPGAIKKKDHKVTGEVYKVTADEKKRIDYLEGSLYTFKKTFFNIDGYWYYAGFYEYNYPEEETPDILRLPFGKWSSSELSRKSHVWYVCYGSNLCRERFEKYIQNTSSKKWPIAEERVIIPHPIYFAKHSGRWSGKGVCFLDINTNGESYGYMYLLPRKQFLEIQEMEGGAWYDNLAYLGRDRYGISMHTMTSSRHYQETEPSKEYLEVIGKGLKDLYELKPDLIKQYLNTVESLNLFEKHIQKVIDEHC